MEYELYLHGPTPKQCVHGGPPIYVVRRFRMIRAILIFLITFSAVAGESECIPIERCYVEDGDDADNDVCEVIGLSEGPKGYEENPDGLEMPFELATKADIEYLESVVTLECNEYVMRVSVRGDEMSIRIGAPGVVV